MLYLLIRSFYSKVLRNKPNSQSHTVLYEIVIKVQVIKSLIRGAYLFRKNLSRLLLDSSTISTYHISVIHKIKHERIKQVLQ